MSKTAALRQLIMTQLNSVANAGSTSFRHAADDESFPYKTFDLSSVALGDLHRDDIDLVVDIWDRGTDSKTVDRIADEIENLFNDSNFPQNDILPTFYRDSRYPVIDNDKLIQHVQMHFIVQNYERNQTTC